MCGARIQEGHQALAVDHHRQEHSPLVSDAHECVEGYHESRRQSGCRGAVNRKWVGHLTGPVGGGVLLDVVSRLQVEEARAYMA